MSYTKEVLMREAMRRGHAARERHVCGKCLDDDGLVAFVEDNACSSKCDYCGKKRKKAFSASLGEVIEHMDECIREEFTDPANVLPYESAEGGWQGQVFDAWELLQKVEFDVESEELLDDVVSAFNDQEWCHRDPFALEPSKRLRYGWDEFKKVVRHARRFTFWSIKDDESEFHPDYMPIGKTLAIIGDRMRDTYLVKRITKGKALWRARVHDAKASLSADHELSPPPTENAVRANRMSPAGIVMFYGAEDFKTACVEVVDPDQDGGKRVTGAEFHTCREMRLLDLVELPKMPSFFRLGKSDFRHTLIFLRHFAADLAIPVVRDGREHIEYVPTQAFTEYVRFELKLHGGASVDGIRYPSAVNGKSCYVLFCTQDECVANPPPYGKHEQWLKFDANSLRTCGLDA